MCCNHPGGRRLESGPGWQCWVGEDSSDARGDGAEPGGAGAADGGSDVRDGELR